MQPYIINLPSSAWLAMRLACRKADITTFDIVDVVEGYEVVVATHCVACDAPALVVQMVRLGYEVAAYADGHDLHFIRS